MSTEIVMSVEDFEQLKARHTALKSENAKLRAALEEIAADEKTYLGHGDYSEEPLPNDYCQRVARAALANEETK